MAPLATTRSFVRRLTDPDRPRTAVALMVAVSAALFGLVLVSLPTPAEGLDTAPVIDVSDDVAPETRLVDAAGEVVLAQPTDDSHRGSTIVNHRRSGVTLDTRLANGTGLSVELVEETDRTTRIVVTSDAVHLCGRYAGTLILTASHPAADDDLLVLDIRFAECPETQAPTLAGSSVNDVSPTWGEDGRAPWRPRVTTTASQPAPPPPPPPAPEPEPAEAEPAEAEPAAAPEPEPEPEPSTTAPEPEPEPTTTSPEPEPEPTATSEPTSDPTPTSEPEPTSDPSPTSEPEPTSDPEPEPTADSTSTTEASDEG